MKTIDIVFIVLAVSLCPFALVQADQNQDEAFYQKCIEEKIANCESKCKLVHARGDHLKSYGERKDKEAEFYKENQENLVKIMVQQEVPKNISAVHHFLIKAFRQVSSPTAGADKEEPGDNRS